MTMLTDDDSPQPPHTVWASHDRCPMGICFWLDCRCEPCDFCEAVHTGRCSYPSAEAEDRRVYA
jgi:hypothetical protein